MVLCWKYNLFTPVTRINQTPLSNSTFNIFKFYIYFSLGQSSSHVEIYFPEPVFIHGQLYIAISGVESRESIKILILSEKREKGYKNN